MTTLTIEVPDELARRISKLAKGSANSENRVVLDALLIYFGLDRQES